MSNMIELQISTEPEPEQDLTSLATVKVGNLVAEAAVRDGRLCIELVDPNGDGEGWFIDCGPLKPKQFV
ncbi:MAG: hypothetical protein ACT4TC_22555 [Myxococcaceae bacterium]